MGDRNNPIKFGPAWMRNFGQISSSGGTTNNSQSNTNSRNGTTATPKGPTAPSGSVSYSGATNTQGQSGEGTAQVSTSSNTTSTTNSGSSGNNEMILAEMRYGREEMLALYERTTDAPEQLKYFDQLYQQRRKPPVALNNTFQEEMQRENTRGAKPATTSRNLNRASPNENRRTRTPFPRNASSGKGILWNMAQKNTRPPNYHPTFEANTAIPWGGNNGNTPQQPPPPRPHIEQHERSGSKVYRRRVNNNTNWRQHSRDEDEWRSRNRPNAERDWGERPFQGKQSTWTANRSGWVGGETNNEESLPEWAVENAVGRTGTFDSTGAFHGYSNDDTNLPKTTETTSSFTLVRSLTHGSLVHNLKTPANGIEEWWASDKAKKLSPNKFETTDVKFKQASNMGPSDDNIPTKISKEENRHEETNVNSDETDKNEISETLPSTPKAQDTATYSDDAKETSLKSKFVESTTFDALMRSDINLENVTDDRGNFQSVLITTNNTLRQKHQNIVTSNENMQRQPRMPILHRLHSLANEDDANTTSKNLVEEMFNLTVDDSKISTSTAASTNANASDNQTDLQMPTQIPSSSIPLSSPRQSMGAMQASGVQSGGMQASGMQAGGIQASGMQAGGMQTSGMQAGGMPIGLMQVGGMQVVGMQTAGMQGLQAGGMQSGGMQATMQSGGMQAAAIQAGNMQSGGMPGGGMQGSNMQAGGIQGGNMQGVGMQVGGMQGGNIQAGNMQAGGMQAGNMQGGIMQAGGMQLHTGVGGRGGYESVGMQHNTMQQGGMHFAAIHPGQLHASGMQTAHAIQQSLLQQAGLQSSAMQGAMQPGEMQANMLQSGRDGTGVQGALQAMQVARMGNALQNIGVPNQALNNAMGLPTSGNGQVIPMPGVSRPMMQNPNVMGFGAADMQPNGSMMSAYHQQGGLSMMSGANVHNSSLFMGHANNSMQAAHEMHRARSDLYQTGQQQAPYGSMYNMIAQSNNGQPQNNINLLDQWYYEDPQYNVHGPFSSKDMYNWYKAGFFNSNLMIRRACDANMSRLGSYGPMAFGAPIDLLPPYPPPSSYDRRTQGPLELHNQKGLGLEESLWHQSAQSSDMLWMAQSVDASNESRVNNLPMHFWDTEPSTITSKSLLPEKTDKEMKAEDQMTAQLRALQNVNTLQTLPLVIKELPGSAPKCDSKPEICPNLLQRLIPNLEEIQKILKEKWLVTIEPTYIKIKEDNVEPSALTSKSILPENIDKDVKSEDQDPVQLMPLANNQSSVSTTSSESQSEVFPLIHERTTPNLEEIQNLLQIKWLVTVASSSSKSTEENEEPEVKGDQVSKEQEPPNDISNGKQEPQSNSKLSVESKAMKSTKLENDKAVKGKTTKSKNKKTKVGKKEEVVEAKAKEVTVKTEIKKSDETTPSKNKKEDKQNRKEVEKDVKEGIMMKEEVKGSDKGVSKDSKKKENAKSSDGGDCNRKEVAVDEKKVKKNIEKSTNDKKQQPETQSAVEIVQSAKKTPWSDAASAQTQSANNYSMTLTNIQRLEREKKMEEIKMQQRMIQIIASQQAETLAREKIMQARLHWAKTGPSSSVALQITDLQAEARMQAAAETSAAAMVQSYIDPELLLPPIPNTPWATSGKTDPPAPIGFWDAQPNNGKAADKPQEAQTVEESNTPTRKKAATPVNIQKEVSPAVLEFDSWCKNVLMVWDKTIDVITFVSFLKDIESPYDVKDYVKFYLGESKDANDFARQFLEKRSKLLRVGTVTPSDDLCSPAMAINPRMSLNSGYQDVKGKGKKAKKNKMLKVDSRILGFSVTASEDRINVGDIDTA